LQSKRKEGINLRKEGLGKVPESKERTKNKRGLCGKKVKNVRNVGKEK
jgi:hypothetical protein